MAHWILQCNPSAWRIRDFFDAGRTSTTWVIRRHWKKMSPGDDVAIWMSGRPGGVVAVGRVSGEPEFGPAPSKEEQFWTSGRTGAGERWTVPVEFTRHFLGAPIRREVLKGDDRFADALILRMPGGANPFPAEDAEWQAIADRVPGGVPGPPHTLVANTVRTAAVVVATGATAIKEAVRSALP
jgi:predicted RNA-binding protein with PUA-like domain